MPVQKNKKFVDILINPAITYLESTGEKQFEDFEELLFWYNLFMEVIGITEVSKDNIARIVQILRKKGTTVLQKMRIELAMNPNDLKLLENYNQIKNTLESLEKGADILRDSKDITHLIKPDAILQSPNTEEQGTIIKADIIRTHYSVNKKYYPSLQDALQAPIEFIQIGDNITLRNWMVVARMVKKAINYGKVKDDIAETFINILLSIKVILIDDKDREQYSDLWNELYQSLAAIKSKKAKDLS